LQLKHKTPARLTAAFCNNAQAGAREANGCLQTMRSASISKANSDFANNCANATTQSNKQAPCNSALSKRKQGKQQSPCSSSAEPILQDANLGAVV